MVDGIRKLLTIMLAAALVGGLSWGDDRARAQGDSVLRLARGLASDNITVLIGRAIVVESTQPFIEVSVADPSVADVSPLSDRSIYIFGKSRGATSLTLLGENGELITNVTVKVIPDLSELKRHLRDVMPNEPIEVRLSGAGVVLSGTVSGAKKISRAMELANSYVGGSAINMMTVGGTQQVMLKVRVAEMQRSAVKNLGFDSALTFADGDVGAGFFSGNNVSGSLAAGTASASFGVTNFGALGAIAELGDFGIGIVLNSLERKGFSRSLAEPNLVALSGSSASFLAGQEVPVPAGGEEGAPDVEFKEVGVRLNFSPTVLDEDVINLSLSAEVSSVSQAPGESIIVAGSQSTAVFSTRRASTTVELRDGESFAIAGMLQDDFSDEIEQFPWLGEIPILGTLFRSSDYSRGETELVVIVSAHLVTAVSEAELSLPIDHVRIPNEFELFLLGHNEAAGAPGMVQSQDFDGDFGYVVE